MALSRCFWVSLLLSLAAPAWALAPADLPSPTSADCLVDPGRRVKASTRMRIQAACDQAVQENLGRLAVAVVPTLNAKPPRPWAVELFRTWQLGRAGRNDGVLLLVSLDEHRAEIILGDGVSQPDDLARSDGVMHNVLVPLMKRGNTGEALARAAGSLVSLLRDSSLNTPESPREVAATPLQWVPSPARVEEEPLRLPYFIVGGTIALVLGVVLLRRGLRYRTRECKTCGQDRRLLDAQDEQANLLPGQLAERSLGSAEWDVWWCARCRDARAYRYGAFFSKIKTCTACGYQTAKRTSHVSLLATTSTTGLLEGQDSCVSCAHVVTFTRILPKLTETTSSNDSSHSSSFSSSSSDSGGSSSGGTTSGDGPSGSW